MGKGEICGKCGNVIAEGALACGSCGAPTGGRRTSGPAPQGDGGLRMFIEESYHVCGVGTVLSVKVEAGVLRRGVKILIQSSNKVGEIHDVKAGSENRTEAFAGDSAGVSVKGIARTDVVRGDIAVEIDHASQSAAG